MTDLIVVEKEAVWGRLKAMVLDSVSSPITRRVYNMALDEFSEWWSGQLPRPNFSKATVSAWRASLESRQVGSSSIIIRMSAIRATTNYPFERLSFWRSWPAEYTKQY